jgi:hypothetical protein
LFSDEDTPITHLIIPTGVKGLTQNNFRKLLTLKAVTFSNDVTTLGDEAFGWCTGLNEINIGKKVTEIVGNPFNGCKNLTSIVVDEENPIYDSRDGCNAIIHTSDNVLLQGCKNTKIPETVTAIGPYAFDDMDDLKTINIPSSVDSINYWAFIYCDGLTSIELPEGLKIIKSQAFRYCRQLTSITLPSTLKTIEYLAFDASPVKIVDIHAKPPPTIPSLKNSVFTSNPIVMVPEGCKEAYQTAEGWKDFTIIEGTTVACGEQMNCIYEASTHTLTLFGTGPMTNYHSCEETPWYNYRSSIHKIEFFNGISTIGDYAFEGCNAIESVELPSSIKTIGQSGFQGCSNLQSIDINEVTYIGDSVFYGCSNLRTVKMEKLKSINSHAFEGCCTIEKIEIPNIVTSIGDYAFAYCVSIKEMKLPSSITDIGESAFYGCRNLQIVVIDAPEIALHGEHAFDDNAENRKIFVYKENLESYKARWSSYTNNIFARGIFYSFDESTGTLTIYGYGEMNVDDYIIDDNSGITPPWISWRESTKTIIIDSGIQSICTYAFYQFNNVTTVKIGNSVEYISYWAFVIGSSLTTLELPNSLTRIESNNFDNNQLTTLYIPRNLTIIEDPSSLGNGQMVSIVVDEDNPVYDSRNDCNAIIETSTNKLVLGCVNTTIPSNVVSIGERAFRYNNFKSITIPSSVTEILDRAFHRCFELDSVTILAPPLKSYGKEAIWDSYWPNNYGKIYVYEEYLDEYKAGWPQYSEIIFPITDSVLIDKINNINLDDNNTKIYYDLSGNRLNRKPNKKGVYIYNGKKILF